MNLARGSRQVNKHHTRSSFEIERESTMCLVTLPDDDANVNTDGEMDHDGLGPLNPAPLLSQRRLADARPGLGIQHKELMVVHSVSDGEALVV